MMALLLLRLTSYALAARDFICTRWWPGWIMAGLLLIPLSCSRSSLGTARAQLLACQEAAAAPKAASTEKASTSSAVRVIVRHGAFESPTVTQPLENGSSWPASPCPDVVVEANAGAVTERKETPEKPVIMPSGPSNGLSLGVGYFLAPVGVVAIQAGKVNVTGLAGPWQNGFAFGGHMTYQLLSW